MRSARTRVGTMLTVLAAGCVLQAVAAGVAAVPAPPAAAGRYEQEIASWRAERLAGLKDPGGWLTLVGLFWLDEGANRLGSDPSCRVALPAGKALAQAGTMTRQGDTVELAAAPGAGITVDGKPVQQLRLHYDAQQKPTMVQLGSLTFFLIKRGDKLGVRVKDSASPALAAFRGIDNFAVDASWRVEARFEPYAKPKKIPITNILGMTADEASPGAVVFERGGKTYRLDALSEAADGSLFVIFADQTSGRETYGAGRFLDAAKPKDGKVVIDFNKAYNPPCAFTSFATCPLPPAQNHLQLAVTAGEKKYGEGAGH
jgi:uncharacterized protein (DUF1684 family)